MGKRSWRISGILVFLFLIGSTWSEGLMGATPGTATLIEPSGVTCDRTPTYIWTPVTGAAYYFLWVTDSTGHDVYEYLNTDEALCSSGTGDCTVTLSDQLALGAAQWTIQVVNEDYEEGDWSSPLSFTVNDETPPGKATLTWPSGTITNTTPTYYWESVPCATHYLLLVKDAQNVDKVLRKYTSAEAGCDSWAGTGKCSIKPSTALALGAWKWFVQTSNSSGDGPWSDPFSLYDRLPP